MPESLTKLLQSLPDGKDLALGGLLETFGSRAHGTALLLLSLPDSIPLPVPSVGAIVGLPLALISAHLAIFGETGGLPRRAVEWRLPARGVALIKRYVVPVIARAERLSRPRLGVLAGRQRLIGLVCLVLSILLFLPIPLMNTPPSLCLALLAWGIVQRDGIFVIAGLASAAALALSLVLLVDRLWSFVA